jgi:hypothetical protein
MVVVLEKVHFIKMMLLLEAHYKNHPMTRLKSVNFMQLHAYCACHCAKSSTQMIQHLFTFHQSGFIPIRI